MRWRSLLQPKQRAFIELRMLAEARARRGLQLAPDLRRHLQDYLARANSIGCSLIGSDRPAFAIVDSWVGTRWVVQQVLGVEKAHFDPARRLGIIAPSTRADLRVVRADTPSAKFERSWIFSGRTRLAFAEDAALGRRRS